MANNERSREKRREERLAEESKAASGDRRTRLLQFAAGGVAVFPSDGLYGLACDPLDAAAIARMWPSMPACDGRL